MPEASPAIPGTGPDAAPIVVDLYMWDLDASSAEVERAAGHLSADEHERAAKFAFERHRNRYVMGRGRLREILASHVGAAPEALAFRYEANGKPHLAAPSTSLHFNLSHCEGFAALAVCRDFALGIDVERVRAIELDLAERYFSPKEAEALSGLPLAEQFDGFFRLWTRKEALVKATGVGLGMDLASFDVSIAPGGPRLLRLASEPGLEQAWALAEVRPEPGVIVAVAARTGGPGLTLRQRTAP